MLLTDRERPPIKKRRNEMAMANVALTCTECGKKYTVTKKCNSRSEADNYETYMTDKDGLCTECWAKEQQAKREADKKELNDKVAEKLEAAGIELPELTGSEKQVTWALQIRHNVFTDLTQKGINWTVVANKKYDPRMQADIDKLFSTSAKSWIDAKMNNEKIATRTVR